MSRRERKAEKNLRAERAAQAKLDAEDAKKAEQKARRDKAKAEWDAKSPEEKKAANKATAAVVGVIVVIILAIIGLSAACGSDADDEKESSSTGQDAEKQDTSPDAPDDVEFSDPAGATGVVFAKFEVKDNFTQGMRTSGAKQRTVEILEYTKTAYPAIDRVFVQGTSDTVDAYGNENSDTVILNVGYDRATLDRINFDGVDQDRIWDLRDAGMINDNILDS